MLIKKNSRYVSHTHELTNAYISLEIFIPTDSVLKSLTFFMNALQKVVTYEKQAQNHEKKDFKSIYYKKIKATTTGIISWYLYLQQCAFTCSKW